MCSARTVTMCYIDYIVWTIPLHRRPNGQEGFVPVNYVKEVEPAVIRNITKKKVTRPVKVKLRKKKTEQRKVSKRRSAALSTYIRYVYKL